MTQPTSTGGRLVPGELDTLPGDIELNAGRPTIRLTVANTGDRPIQVGSHYHFFETNDALAFDRQAAYGFRLDIPAGTAVRFEPGQTREVELVALGGARVVHGFAGRVMGPLDGAKSTRGRSPAKGTKSTQSVPAARPPKAAGLPDAPASGPKRTTTAHAAATARESGAHTPARSTPRSTTNRTAGKTARRTSR